MTSQDSYLLLANSQSEMDTWVRALRHTISSPTSPSATGVFGRRLEEAMATSTASGGGAGRASAGCAAAEAARVPELVVRCVDFIRCHGLKEEGLFRLPGQATLVRELQERCDYGDLPRLDASTDVHTVTSLLKLYLRELPEPLVPFRDYQAFLSCATLLEKDNEKGMKELASLVLNLPSANFFLLKYICSFLDEVQSHSSVNKMSAHNLATVFGPNILRPSAQDPVAIMEGATMVQHLMMLLIIYHGELFQNSPVNTCSSASRPNGIVPGSRGSTVCWDIGEASNGESTATATAEKLEEQRRLSESERAMRSPSERHLATRKCSSLRVSSSDKMGMEHHRGNLLASSNQSKPKRITGGRELTAGLGSGVHRQSMYDNVPGCGRMLESPAESGHELQVSDGGRTTEVMDLVRLQKDMTKQMAEYELQIQGLDGNRQELETRVERLTEDLEAERRKGAMTDIRLRNSERAREDAERRNAVMQREMETFFSTFGHL
uniref:rho GTPase-activating protein 22 n=1 Tax=Myxine glutinosa TaxID=7769 RepID=UPI00358F5EB6